MRKHTTWKTWTKKSLSVLVAGSMCLGYSNIALAKEEKGETKETRSDIKKQKEEQETVKEETVYVKADPTGKAKNTIVSEWLKNPDMETELFDDSDLTEIQNVKGDETYRIENGQLIWEANGNDIYYQGKTSKELPVEVKITYYLDGEEISPNELAGKSGKVRIRYQYEYKDKKEYVPFIMVTGVLLPVEHFTNVTVTDGQVVSDGSRNIVMGMGIPGLERELKLDQTELGKDIEIPDSFEVTADVTDFQMSLTLTAATSGLFSDLDEKGDFDLKDLKKSLDEMQEASTSLVDGSGKLSEGVKTLAEGCDSLAEGAVTLDKNMGTLAGGIQTMDEKKSELTEGLYSLSKGIVKLQKGAKQLKRGIDTYTEGAASLKSGVDAYTSGADTLAKGVEDYTKGTDTLAKGVTEYTGGADNLAEGVGEYVSGAEQLSKGVTDYTAGTKTLTRGVQGYTGEIQKFGGELSDYTSGVDQLAEGTTQYAKSVEQITGRLEQAVQGQISAQKEEGMSGQAATSLQKAIDSDTRVLNILTDARSAVSSAVNAHQAAIALAGYSQTVQEYMGKLDASIASLQTSIDQQRQALSQLSGKDQTKQDSLQAILGDLKSLTGQNAALSQNILSLKQGSEQVRSEVKSADSAAGTLNAGASQLNQSAKTLESGARGLEQSSPALREGVKNLTAASANVKKGAKDLTANSEALRKGAKQITSSSKTLTSGASSLAENGKKLTAGAKEIKQGMDTLAGGSGQLNEGAATLSRGIGSLRVGSNLLKEGTGTLSQGTAKVNAGVSDLWSGADQLWIGMKEFDEKAVGSLQEVLGKDLESLADRIQKVVNAGADYQNFAGIRQGEKGSVKFLIETEEIEAQD